MVDFKIQTAPEHEAFYQASIDFVRKHSETLDPLEMLAIAANLVGKLLAMQDQRVWTAPKLMEVVAKNLELGNEQMVAEIFGSTKGTG